jgi:hypothetical protein
MNIHRIIIAVMAMLASSPLVGTAADRPFEAQFITQVQAAFDAKDASKLLALVCWDNVESSLKQSMEQQFSNLVTQTPSSIKLAPPDPKDKYEYSRGGVSYRTNLVVTKLLKIEFAPGSRFNTTGVTMPLGEKQGGLMITTAAPSK